MTEFLKVISIYGLSNAISAALGFIILPLITSSLSLEEYGTYSLIASMVAALVVLLSLSLETGLMRFATQGENLQNSFFK